MANALALGSVVVNFNTTAVVVGFFKAASGPSDMDGWPILRELGPLKSGGFGARGGKWVADPAKCDADGLGIDDEAGR